METELTLLADTLGFKSYIIDVSKSEDDNESYYHLWLCDLHKYIRDVYNLYIELFILSEGDYVVRNIVEIGGGDYEPEFKVHKTYEKALERGLIEAIKIIFIENEYNNQ